MPLNDECREKCKVYDHNGEVKFQGSGNGKGSRSRITDYKKYRDNFNYWWMNERRKNRKKNRKKQ